MILWRGEERENLSDVVWDEATAEADILRIGRGRTVGRVASGCVAALPRPVIEHERLMPARLAWGWVACPGIVGRTTIPGGRPFRRQWLRYCTGP
jgi:hypothetical protein